MAFQCSNACLLNSFAKPKTNLCTNKNIHCSVCRFFDCYNDFSEKMCALRFRFFHNFPQFYSRINMIFDLCYDFLFLPNRALSLRHTMTFHHRIPPTRIRTQFLQLCPDQVRRSSSVIIHKTYINYIVRRRKSKLSLEYVDIRMRSCCIQQ